MIPTRSHLVACLVFVAGAGACGDDGGARVTVTMAVGEAAPRYGATPFPTDALREGARLGVVEGLDAIVVHHTDLVARHLAALDGFGLRPAIELFVDGALEPTSIPAHTRTLADAAFVLDVDPASPARGQVVPMVWRHDATRGAITGVPELGHVLREGTRYAAVVTTDVLDADGTPIGPAPALVALARRPPPARWATTAEAYVALDADPALAGRIAGLTVFTTQHASAPLVAARAVLDAEPAPTLTFDDPALIFAGTARLERLLGTATLETSGPRAGAEAWGADNPTGIAHAHVGVIATGRLGVVRFRRDDPGTEEPDDETFDVDPTTGVPRVIARETIPVTIVLPAAPPPAAGYPVILFGHGLGNSREHVLPFAEPLTAQGYAIVVIDLFGHGSRRDPRDVRNNLRALDAFTGDPELVDGFGDHNGVVTQFDFFEGFMNAAAIRDSIRQSALDLGGLARAVRRADLDLAALAGPGGVPRLDPRRPVFLGESFGTVVGTLLAAIEPDVDLYVLDVPGGGILDLILPSSAVIGSVTRPLVHALYEPTGPLDRFDPFLALMQATLDGADPLTYAPHVLGDRFTIGGAPLGPRHVICLEVLGDEIMPNVSTEALAAGLGLDVLAPHLDLPAGFAAVASPAAGNRDGQTAVLVQYAPATHGANWTHQHGELTYRPGFPLDGDEPYPELPAPIEIANPIYPTFDQVFAILASHRAGGVPRVISTLAPVHDFDGDGTLDGDDPAPEDPAR